MAAQCGAGILVKITDDAGTPALQTVLGLRSRSIKFNGQIVDVTNAESTSGWRELLASCGILSCQISGSGVFDDDNGIEAARDAFFDRTNRACEFFVPGLGTFSGSFRISELEYTGEYNDSVMCSLTLESAGVISFATA